MILTNRLTPHSLGFIENFDRLLNQAVRGLESVAQPQPSSVYDYESDQSYVLRIEIPGFTKEEIHLSLEDDEIKISAQAGDENHPFQESFEETFSYPDDIQMDAISAKLENGILELTLPKKEVIEPTTQTIEIQ